jgi:NAD(P)-dependent dehydrogenase (short-subunit alcohol dehydrogenase family)
LGLDAAILLAQIKCSTIVLACRTLAKGEKAKQVIEAACETTAQKPQFVLLELDLSNFQSVVAFSERCKDLPRLDTAMLNAGVYETKFSLAEEYETTITVNVISTFLLTTLLVPILRQSATKYDITPTIAIVGSAVHFWATEKDLTSPAEGQILKTLSDPRKANMQTRYLLSKLPVMLLVKYLASILTKSARADPTGKPLVIVNNVAPGWCDTNLNRTAGIGYKSAIKLFGRSSELGARTLVHGAIAGKESHGQYLSECQVKPASGFVRSAEGDKTAQRLWNELSAIYENIKPGCTREL